MSTLFSIVEGVALTAALVTGIREPLDVYPPPRIEEVVVSRQKLKVGEPVTVRAKIYCHPDESIEEVESAWLYYRAGRSLGFKSVPMAAVEGEEDLYEGRVTFLETGKVTFYVRAIDTEGNVAMTFPEGEIQQEGDWVPKEADWVLVMDDLHHKPELDPSLRIDRVLGAADEKHIYVRIEMGGEVAVREKVPPTKPIYAISFSTADDLFAWRTGLGRFLLVYVPNFAGLLPFKDFAHAGDAIIAERDVEADTLLFVERYLPAEFKVRGNVLLLRFPRFLSQTQTKNGWFVAFATALGQLFENWNIREEVPRAVQDLTPMLRLYIQKIVTEVAN